MQRGPNISWLPICNATCHPWRTKTPASSVHKKIATASEQSVPVDQWESPTSGVMGWIQALLEPQEDSELASLCGRTWSPSKLVHSFFITYR